MMKTIVIVWFYVLTFAAAIARGQGAFQNLDFESANLVFAAHSTVEVLASNAMPGWSVFQGSTPLSTITYNNAAAPTTGLLGSNHWVISGNFSAYINEGTSISQAGLVPVGTASLLFEATYPSLVVSLNGQDLSYTAIANATNSYGLSYILYGADISAFAGQLETLSFSAPAHSDGTLDNIQFSSSTIPEPSDLALLTLGCSFFYVRLYRRYFR